MSSPKTIYVCGKCDAQSPKWNGVCLECGAFGTLEPQRSGGTGSVAAATAAASRAALTPFADVDPGDAERVPTGIKELDRVLGGGLVRGSVILLGGEPGIGKSTLSLSLCAAIAAKGARVIYFSGEESPSQVKMRATRMGVPADRILFSTETEASSMAAAIVHERPALAIVDSIQTVHCDDIPSESGTLAQVRVAAQRLAAAAKSSGTPLILIGHVTKDGHVAGPKTLEHLVDAVLSFEGERTSPLRLLRGLKNRFGTTDETGIFSMGERGLEEIANPSAYLLEERRPGMPGSAVCCLLEGTRPILVEIQALTRRAAFGYPARRASGFDQSRLEMLLAVLGRRGGIDLGEHDVYVNVIGGLKAKEPAADLAVALAIASAATNTPLPEGAACWGEIGLGGEVRSVMAHDRRCKESSELGVGTAIASRPRSAKPTKAISLLEVRTVADALRAAGIDGSRHAIQATGKGAVRDRASGGVIGRERDEEGA
jgi:DNA repair protein RadA/Sms